MKLIGWIGVECPDCFVDFHHYPMVVPRRVARQAQSEKMRRGKPTMRSGETSLRIDTVRRGLYLCSPAEFACFCSIVFVSSFDTIYDCGRLRIAQSA